MLNEYKFVDLVENFVDYKKTPDQLPKQPAGGKEVVLDVFTTHQGCYFINVSVDCYLKVVNPKILLMKGGFCLE